MNRTIYPETIVVKSLYAFFIAISILFGSIAIWNDLKELIERLSGSNTIFSQMIRLADSEAVWYLVVYLVANLLLLSFGIYFVAKNKKKTAFLLFLSIFLIFAVGLYTDYLITIRI
jgi:hypothetical protein